MLNIRRYVSLLVIAGVSGVLQAAPPDMKELPKGAVPALAQSYRFDQMPNGRVGDPFFIPSTELGRAEEWMVAELRDAYSPPRVLRRHTAAAASDSTSALLLLSSERLRGELAVRFKTLSTDDAQTAGLIFRYIDPLNYTVLLVDSRHDALSLFDIKKGKRKLVDSKEALVTPLKWHQIRLAFTEDRYTVAWNGELLMGGKLKRADGPGACGLAAAANSDVAFDDLELTR